MTPQAHAYLKQVADESWVLQTMLERSCFNPSDPELEVEELTSWVIKYFKNKTSVMLIRTHLVNTTSPDLRS